MIQIKQIGCAGILFLLLTGCDKRNDPFLLRDKGPQVFIERYADTLYQKNIVDSNKIGVVYQVNVKYFIDEKIPLKMNKYFITDSMSLVGKLLSVYNNNEGESYYSLKLTDSYGKTDSAVLKLISFKNLPPVCFFTVIQDSFKITIDASKSYDQDKKWGGKIIEYEYNLNGMVLKNSLDSINYIFGSKGQKMISVRVMDNDKSWSEIITKYINI